MVNEVVAATVAIDFCSFASRYPKRTKHSILHLLIEWQQVELLNEGELSKYVDVDCLPTDLGGDVTFKVDRWIEYQQVSDWIFFRLAVCAEG